MKAGKARRVEDTQREYKPVREFSVAVTVMHTIHMVVKAPNSRVAAHVAADRVRDAKLRVVSSDASREHRLRDFEIVSTKARQKLDTVE